MGPGATCAPSLILTNARAMGGGAATIMRTCLSVGADTAPRLDSVRLAPDKP